MLKRRLCWGLATGVLLIVFAGAPAFAKIAQENHKRIEKQHQGSGSNSSDDTEPGENGLLYLGDLFQGIKIRSPLGDEFNDLYFRNKAEIHRIIDLNPGIVWETVGLVIELMPALRSAGENGGSLSVDKRLYSRATDLFGKCEHMASPQLATDLKKARALVESRTTERDAQQLLIDLSQ